MLISLMWILYLQTNRQKFNRRQAHHNPRVARKHVTVAVDSIDFGGFIFPSDINFNRSVFYDRGQFFPRPGSRAMPNSAMPRFEGLAWFEEARFKNTAGFNEARFEGHAWFKGARFEGDAWFGAARFKGDAWFGAARFEGDARFKGARFKGNAWFKGAQFESDAWFDNARFEGRCLVYGGAVHRYCHFYTG